ncbi:hypothetical protein GCM10009624_07160 [Gordonia sinesedis]
MSHTADHIAFDSVEINQVEDILDCTTDDSIPVLLTQEAFDGSDEDLIAVNRDVVNKVLDREPSLDDISRDALRSYYVDMYAQTVAAAGLRAYTDVATGDVHTFVLQGLQLMDIPAHRDLLVATIGNQAGFDEAAFDAAFAAAEETRSLAAANAAYLRALPERQVLSEKNFQVALDIRLGHVDSDTGVHLDLPRWTGVVTASGNTAG